jgi:hypothetical protein
VVADREGVSADDGRGDRGEVVRVEGLGRGTAESVLGGVMPRGTLGGLGQLLESVCGVACWLFGLFHARRRPSSRSARLGPQRLMFFHSR